MNDEMIWIILFGLVQFNLVHGFINSPLSGQNPTAVCKALGLRNICPYRSSIRNRVQMQDSNQFQNGDATFSQANQIFAQTFELVGSDRSTQLQVAIPSLLLGAIWIYLTSPPGVLSGILNSILDEKDKIRTDWVPEDLTNTVGRTLGKGTFGTAFEGFPSGSGLKKLGQKEGKVVLKRVADDRQVFFSPLQFSDKIL